MDRPMTTSEFFDRLCGILKAGGMMPGILDYGIAERKGVPMRTSEFSLRSCLDYGGSEGIYLDLWIEYEEEGSRTSARLGTFKTLEDDRSAMRTMAVLLADIIVEGYACARKNSDDFTWEGFHVYALDSTGRSRLGTTNAQARNKRWKRRMSCLGNIPLSLSGATARDGRRHTAICRHIQVSDGQLRTMGMSGH